MTYFPKTLSKSLREELYPESQFTNTDQLLARLKTKPRMLLAFFEQVCLSSSYVKKNENFISKVIYQINDLSFACKLPFDEVIKTFNLFLKFTAGSIQILPSDLVVNIEDKTYHCSRIIFMMECGNLKIKWMNDPGEKQYAFHEFAAALLDIEELTSLYFTFLSHDFTFFHTVSNEELLRHAIQSEVWGYRKGSFELQTMLCRRIIHLNDLLFFYGKAKAHCLSCLELYCQEALDKFEYSYVKEDDCDYYHAAKLNFDDDTIVSMKPLDRLHFVDQYFKEKFDQSLPSNGFLERMEFGSDSKGSISVKKLATRDPEEIELVRDTFNGFPKRKLERTSVKHLIFDGRVEINSEVIMGLIHYFDQVNEISFFYFKNIDSKLFTELAKNKPHLRVLRMRNCVVGENVLLQIPIFFKELESLNLNNVNLSAEVFSYILSLPRLIRIELIQSSFQMPANINSDQLLYVDITGSTSSISDIIGFLKAFKKICVLACNLVPLLSLDQIPYPENIQELSVDCSQLEKSVDIEGIELLNRFNKLNTLYLHGSPSLAIKGFLLPLMKKMKIIFKNILIK